MIIPINNTPVGNSSMQLICIYLTTRLFSVMIYGHDQPLNQYNTDYCSIYVLSSTININKKLILFIYLFYTYFVTQSTQIVLHLSSILFTSSI